MVALIATATAASFSELEKIPFMARILLLIFFVTPIKMKATLLPLSQLLGYFDGFPYLIEHKYSSQGR
jgi:hypothetical protein